MSERILQPGTRGNPDGDVLIVGEAYGSNEEREQKPFVGASGQELDRMLKEAGIDPGRCYYTNVVNMRPPGNELSKFFIPTEEAKRARLSPYKGLFPDEPVIDGLTRLQKLIEDFNPKLIIGFGNYSLWALSDNSFKISNGTDFSKGYKVPTGIASYRGSQLFTAGEQPIPLLPTYHPAYILRDWSARNTCVHDLRARASRFLNGKITWNEPARNYIVQPTFQVVMAIVTNLILRAELSPHPVLLSADIETIERHMDCIGLAWSRHDAICIPVFKASTFEEYWTPQEEVEVLTLVRKLLTHPNIFVAGQNFFYDFQYFFAQMAGTRPNWKHDTMLAHHVLFPGTPADLVHISSMYCDWHQYWKDDLKDSKAEGNDLKRWTYNCRDVVVTYEAITALWDVIKYYDMGEQYSIQMVRAHAILEPMLKGILVDKQKRNEEQLIHFNTVSELEYSIEQSMPSSIWVNQKNKSPWYRSNQQLAEIFYDILGVDEIRDRKTHRRTMNDDALDKIGKRHRELKGLVTKLQMYRTMEAFQQFLKMKIGSDGRMRCSFAPTTETFRYRSGEDAFGSGRNLMNLPKGNEED